jgi:hypothetical protein
MEMTITGGCLCKAVQYRVTAAPIATRMCWCRVCQYLACGNATVNACFPSNAITVEGELRDFELVAASGNRMHRRFCPTCGTQMFSEAESRPHLIFIRVGTLDDPEIAKPVATIWVSEAPEWACIDKSIAQVEQQPPPVA